MWRRININPKNQDVGDCTIRAISMALNQNWYLTHSDLCALSRQMADMPSSNRVLFEYLKLRGYTRHTIETECPNCLSVIDFCNNHPVGEYLLSTCDYVSANKIVVTASHMIFCAYGTYYDSWNSGREIPLYYFEKEKR